MKKFLALVIALSLFTTSSNALAVCVRNQWKTSGGQVAYAIIDKDCNGYAEEKQQFIYVRGRWNLSAIWCWNGYVWVLIWEVGEGPATSCPVR